MTEKRALGHAWDIARIVAEVDKQLLSSDAVKAFAQMAVQLCAEDCAAHETELNDLRKDRELLLRICRRLQMKISGSTGCVWVEGAVLEADWDAACDAAMQAQSTEAAMKAERAQPRATKRL